MPKKYIELDAALAALGEEPYVWVDYSEALTQEHNDWEFHYNAISAIPAADVVEVVRCRDCVYWRGENDICKGICIDFSADGYCSEGKRKDGVQDDV